MNKGLRVFFVPLVLIGLFACYLYINPVFYVLKHVLSPRRLPNLEAGRNYYSILSSFSGFLLGISGLVVGYLYYKHKQKLDASVSERERRRKRLDDLIANLSVFDSLVDDLIHFRFDNNKELEDLRQKIHRSFENIELMIDLNHILLELDDDDIAAIVEVYAFVEKNDLLMQKSYEECDASRFIESLHEYVALIKAAKLRCLKRVA